MSDVKPLTDEEMAIWRERAANYEDKEDVAIRLIATVDEKERQRAAAVARRASELKAIEAERDALRAVLQEIADDHVDYGESFEGQFLMHKEIAKEALAKTGVAPCNHSPMHWNGPIQSCPKCGVSIPAPCESSGAFADKLAEIAKGK